MSLVWVNGKLVDKAEARVSPFDHGFLYGDGVWEHLRVFGGKPFRVGDHLERLYSSAGFFEIAVPYTPDELVAAVAAAVRANHRTDAYVRVIVTRGPGNLGPDPRKTDPQVYVIAEEYQPFPPELYGHGLHAATCGYPVNRPSPASFVRSLSRPDIALAKSWALKAGCLEAILLDDRRRVWGGTEGELMFVRGGEFCRVGGADSVAAGVALDLARSMLPLDRAGGTGDGLPDLMAADEVFLAGTACGIIGIVRIDGTDIGPGTEGPVTRAVREAYHQLTRGDGPPRGTLPDEGGAE